MVEEAFPEVALEGGGGGAVAVEVAEPFAVVGIGEVSEAPVVELLVPAGVFGVVGELVGEEGGDECFVVGPPEFHIVPVFLDGFVVDVAEVEQAAELGIPAALPHPVEHLATEPDEAGILAVFSFGHDEPGAFDGVAGVERAGVEVVDDGAIGRDGFHDALEVRFDEVAFNFVEAAIDPGFEARLGSEAGAEFLGGDEGDHAGAHADEGAGIGELGRHFAGGKVPVGEMVKELEGAIGVLGLLGGLGIGGAGDGVEGFAVGVASFPDGLAIAGEVEEHAAIGVEAVLFEEVDAGLAPMEPVVAAFELVVEREEHPGDAALGPD